MKKTKEIEVRKYKTNTNHQKLYTDKNVSKNKNTNQTYTFRSNQ